MKCAFIIPAWVPEEIFSSKTASSQINYWQPVGTLSVAAVLQQAGHFVKFINGAFLTHEQVLAEIEQFRPAFIGHLCNNIRLEQGPKDGGGHQKTHRS